MALVEAIKKDKEIAELRSKWKEKKTTPFPLYNHDEYRGIEDYKEKIRQKLKHS